MGKKKRKRKNSGHEGFFRRLNRYDWNKYVEAPIPDDCVSGIYVAKVVNPKDFADKPRYVEYRHYDKVKEYVDEVVNVASEYITFSIDGELRRMKKEDVVWEYMCPDRNVYIEDCGPYKTWAIGFGMKEIRNDFNRFYDAYGDLFGDRRGKRGCMKIAASYLKAKKFFDWKIRVGHMKDRYTNPVYRFSSDRTHLVKEKKSESPEICIIGLTPFFMID